MTKIKKSRMVLSAAALSFVLGGTALANVPEVPRSKDDHLTLAREYETKAAAERKQAADELLAKEKLSKKAASTPKMPKPVWLVKEEKSYEAKSAEASKRAEELEKAADFHKSRARELEGQ